MASSTCLRRPSAALPPVAARLLLASTATAVPSSTSSAPFSTSASLLAQPTKPGAKTTVGKFRQKMASAYRKSAPKVVPHGRRPDPGARKAFRKRVTLSNGNALPVEGSRDLAARTMADGDESEGRVFGLSGELIDSLRAVEAFKPTQGWGLFRRPHVLVRKETVDLVGRMERAVEERRASRVVLTGEKIAGKSLLLLQAIAHAMLNKWVVINIPEAQDLVNANTEYSPIESTSPLQFSQPVYIIKLLQTILRTNAPALKSLKLSRQYPELGLHLPKDATLADLAGSTRDQDAAWRALDVFWRELTTVEGRPPVLLALDGLAHVMGESAYRDPDHKVVHAHDLALVGLFVDVLSGKRPLANGGAVVAATSRGNSPRVKSMDLALAHAEARARAAADGDGDGGVAGLPVREPYRKGYDDRVYEALRDVEVLKVGGVTKEEARAVMDYWAASGVLRATVTEAAVTEKWALGGSGNLGEMERVTLMNMRL